MVALIAREYYIFNSPSYAFFVVYMCVLVVFVF